MTVVLLAGLEIGQVLLSLLSFAPDAPVEDAHDGDGRVEGGDGRAERDVIVCLDKLDEAFICLERERREKHTIRSGLDPLDKSFGENWHSTGWRPPLLFLFGSYLQQ